MSPAFASVVVSVPTCVATGWFSAMLDGDNVMFVGAWFSFTSVTGMVSALAKVPPLPSLVWTRTV